MTRTSIRVTVWGENVHERTHRRVAEVYPDGMHEAIAAGLRDHLGDAVVVRTATLDQGAQGLPDALLEDTDVLTWWGHVAHGEVDDGLVDRIQARVLAGMGLIVLHSGHLSKIFRRLMGTSCSLKWREADEREVMWVVDPTHPIAEGIGPAIVLPEHEMYGEFFDIPAPDSLVFISNFPGGEVFRSGCCFRRGKGRVFYFSPGHETYPIFFRADIRHVLANAVQWAAAVAPSDIDTRTAHAPVGWFEDDSVVLGGLPNNVLADD